MLLFVLSNSSFAGNTHGDPNPQRELEAFFGDALAPFQTSGCLPPVPSSSATFAAFACQGYVQGSTLSLIYVTQSAATLGPLTGGDGIYWLGLHRDTSTAVSTWTRQRGTHYLWQKAATRPAAQTSTVIFARVLVSAGVITLVDDLRVPRSWVLSQRYSVRDPLYGAFGNNTNDDRAAIQAAVDGLRTGLAYGASTDQADSLSPRGGIVYFPRGLYKSCSSIVMPRTYGGKDEYNVIWLVGESDTASLLMGCGTSFDTALGTSQITWSEDAPHFSDASYTTFNPQPAWNQRISNLGFELPQVLGTQALKFQATAYQLTAGSGSGWTSSRLQLSMDHVHFLVDANYQSAGIMYYNATCWGCNFSFLRVDVRNSNQVSDAPYNPVLFRTATTEPTGLDIKTIDGLGLEYSRVEHVMVGQQRSGPITFYQGRCGQTSFNDINMGLGANRDNEIYLFNSGGCTISMFQAEGGTRSPTVHVESSDDMKLQDFNIGSIRPVYGAATNTPLARTKLNLINTRNLTIEHLRGTRQTPAYFAGVQHCLCASGANAGALCTTTDPPCSNTSGGLTCAGGDAICMPQDTREVWAEAQCTNNGAACGSFCVGGAWNGRTCYTSSDCDFLMSGGNLGFGAGVCTATVCGGGGTCAQVNKGLRILDSIIPDSFTSTLWIPNPDTGYITADVRSGANASIGRPELSPLNTRLTTSFMVCFNNDCTTAIPAGVAGGSCTGSGWNNLDANCKIAISDAIYSNTTVFTTPPYPTTAANSFVTASCASALVQDLVLTAEITGGNAVRARMINNSASGAITPACGVLRFDVTPR